MSRRHQTAGALAFVLAIGLAPAANAQSKEPIKIAIGVDAAYVPMYLSKQDKLFEKNGVNVELVQFTQGGDALDAVAGVVNFLNLAEQLGYETVCLGPAVAIDALLAKIEALDPALVAVGYRLTPENCRSLLADLAAKVKARGHGNRRWLFGGTEPCVAAARETGLFQRMFASGASKAAVVAFLRGEQAGRWEITVRLADKKFAKLSK